MSVVWGEEDPWEKIEWGREFAKYASVQVRKGLLRGVFDGLAGRELTEADAVLPQEFVSLPGVGHCPQHEAAHLVNPLIQQFVKRVGG